MDRGLAQTLLEAGAGEWAMIISLVFGGCCSNVWALEAVLKSHPNSGKCPFALRVPLYAKSNLRPLLDLRPVPLCGRTEPLIPGLLHRILMDTAGAQTRRSAQKMDGPGRHVPGVNNYAFGLKIPVTIHIIFRSGGLCVSMLTGYLFAKRRYSVGQVFAGILITSGIVLATISAPSRRPRTVTTTATPSTEYLSDGMQYFSGIVILGTALFISAWLGLWQEQTFKMYGKKWREGLFYCHFLSLPFFIPIYPTIASTYSSFASTTPITLLAIPGPVKSFVVPSALLALAVNVVTQGMCIRGVNRLTARVNSVTVNLVLTVRKAVSLAISVWYYGSGVSTGLALGGGMVLVGTMVYSMAPGPVGENVQESRSKKESESKLLVYGAEDPETRARVSAIDASEGKGKALRERAITRRSSERHSAVSGDVL